MSKVEERYAKATRSSHLELKRTDEAPGDADTIIAAGLAETMGILMTRLRGEWDSATGTIDQYRKARAEWGRLARNAEQLAKQCADAADRAEKALKTAKPYERAELVQEVASQKVEAKRQLGESQRFWKEATREAVTERWEILSGLRTLEPAKQALFTFAVRQAPLKACGSSPEALGKLVGQVLDVWLDKLCHHCEGRGFSGGYGSARLMCGKCRGTGSRSHSKLGENAAERAFGLWLLNVLDSKVSGSMKQVQRKTRNF